MVGADEGSDRDPQLKLEEAVALAEAAGFTCVIDMVAPLQTVSAATFLGSGKVEQVRQLLTSSGANSVLVNAALTGIQQRNLADALGLPASRVLDRVTVILEIFARRARTREAQLQVRLAQLRHARSRLVGGGTASLSQQRGGIGVMGGAGEKKLELDRRRLEDEVRRTEKAIGEVARTRQLHRAARARAGLPTVGLVGYTNVGKSALAAALSGSGKFRVKDALFATLDSKGSAIHLPGGGRALLVDTVGFVSDLPHDLVASFRATLEEATNAQLLLHVLDASHPHAEAQRRDVVRALSTLGLDYGRMLRSGRLLEVVNKVDRLVVGLPADALSGSGSGRDDTTDPVASATDRSEQGSVYLPPTSTSYADNGTSGQQHALLGVLRKANAHLRLAAFQPQPTRRHWDDSASDDGGASEAWPPPGVRARGRGYDDGDSTPYAGTDDGGHELSDAETESGGTGLSDREESIDSDVDLSPSDSDVDSDDKSADGQKHDRPYAGPFAVAISARTGLGLDDLRAEIGRRLQAQGFYRASTGNGTYDDHAHYGNPVERSGFSGTA